MSKIYKYFYPISFLSNNTLLLFKKGKFYILDIKSSKYRKLGQIRLSLIENLIYLIPFLPRILRFGIRCALKINDKIVLFVIKNTIYELNLQDRFVTKGYSIPDNSRPLAFTQIEDITGFEDGVYFGGYIGNPLKKPIAIYKRISIDNWIKVFQFPNGAIEHIHNIVADKFNDTVFIFTGDFDHSAGIWIAKDNFASVEPLLIGEQKYRGCVAFPTNKGLIYATDSPFTENSIRLINKDDFGKWTTKQIKSINGPCIYGCEWNDDIVFSTSVEGDGRNQNFFYKMLGRNRGKGIKNDYCIIYKGNLEKGFEVIYSIKKDILPFYLFQFGVLIFPSGKNESAYLPVYHIATTKHDMSTLLLTQ